MPLVSTFLPQSTSCMWVGNTNTSSTTGKMGDSNKERVHVEVNYLQIDSDTLTSDT